MLFNSIEFLLFFPVVVLLYFVLPPKNRYFWLLLASYYFYMCWNPAYILLIVVSTVITYLCGRAVEALREKEGLGEQQKKKWMKLTVAAGFLVNIGLLAYFKYTNFFVDCLNGILSVLKMAELPRIPILLPVGISFFTLQALGYTVDVYRGDVKAEKNLFKYALFVSFFPQLVAGPIERSGNLLGQIQEEPSRRLWDYHRITKGLMIMLWGFFMKLVIADRAAILVDTVFDGYERYQMTGLTLGIAVFAVQIYCDFAGYSTIAAGAAKVLGFELMENFNTPFFAESVSDFWRRWHISLGTWFRDYLYIPLGGSRCGKAKRYRNLLLTFGISGLWHGADITYIIWGLLHGFYQIAEKELSPVIKKINEKCSTRTESFGYRFFKVCVTFLLFEFALIFFRAESLHQAVHYIYRMLSCRDWWSLFDQSIYQMGLDITEMHILVFGIMILFAVDLLKYWKGQGLAEYLEKQWIVFRWCVLLGLLFVCIVFGCYGPGFDSSQFIYFQF